MSALPQSEKATPAVAFCFFVNRLLEAEPWALERLAPFAGETLDVLAPPLPVLRLTIVEGGRLRAGGDAPGLTVRVRPEALLELPRGEERFLRAVEVTGNAKLAQEVLSLARHLRWDVEEDLSRVVGDIAAHRLVEAARSFAAWQADAARRLVAAAVDYLTVESPLLARRDEQAAHAGAVAELRDALARLEKRIERLD